MMTENDIQLYQEIVLEHNKNPQNCGPLADFTHFVEGYNQLCGDDINLYLKVHANVIEDISFTGDVSALTKAAASIMTTIVKGKTTDEAQELYRDYMNLIGGKDSLINEENYPQLLSLAQVKNFPTKIQCTTLGWHTLNGALNNEKLIQT